MLQSGSIVRNRIEGCSNMKAIQISNDKQFYQAVMDYSSNVWQWRGHDDDDFENDPTPDELIQILSERIEWIRQHKSAVEKYLLKRRGPTWVRVIDGSRAGPAA